MDAGRCTGYYDCLLTRLNAAISPPNAPSSLCIQRAFSCQDPSVPPIPSVEPASPLSLILPMGECLPSQLSELQQQGHLESVPIILDSIPALPFLFLSFPIMTNRNENFSCSSLETSISGSGDTYYATVSAATDGTYNLDLISSGHNIEDESSNPLTDTASTGADETYTVSTN